MTGRILPPSAAARAAADAAFREEWGRIVATLIRRTGDWDLAEDAASEAFAQALDSWTREGIPSRPGAWLTTVASNRALDRLRRVRRGGELLETIGRDPAGPLHGEQEDETMRELLEEPDEIEDDRLRLIFTCCHPALALEARVALTLRALAGLTTAEIARAFLVSESTMAKRLTRAKAKIAGAGIPYRVPPSHLLPDRTAGVLAVLWLLFNEGYSATGGQELIRAQLCEEAIRLARALVMLMPDEPEASGLLALMLLQHSRRRARVDDNGDLITLEDQDRTRWEAAEIADGRAVLEAALRRRVVGPYQLQAAIAACHADASEPAATDWEQIAGLYGLLLTVMDTPIVALNRAVAVAMAGDLDAGLQVVDRLAREGELSHYHLLYATRADLLRRRGDLDAARTAYEQALELAGTEPERRFIARRLRELG